MPKKTQDLQQFLITELQDVYDAEKQLVRALPKMAKAAQNEELRTAITEHIEVTKNQVQRLEQCFEHLGQKAKSKPCKGMRGILEEGKEMLEEDMEEGVMDAAIAASGRKIEHYEIVSYEGLRAVAEQLGMNEVAELLGETLEEEQQTDQQLNEICQQAVQEAVSASEMEDEGEEMDGEGGDEGPKGGRGASRAGTQARGKAATKSGGGRGASGGGKTRGAGGGSGGGASAHGAHPITDHDEIRQWAEDRGAKPTCVRGTGKKGDIGMIRLDFPGYSGADSLEEIEWDEWFEKFDENGLALLVQEQTASGEQSNFNKLVSREGAQSKRPKAQAAR